MSEKDTPKGHFVIGKNIKKDGKFKLVFCTSCGQAIRILVPKKKRANKHERLLKALLSSCQVNKVGCLVTNDIGGFFGGLTKEQERELIKINESMK